MNFGEGCCIFVVLFFGAFILIFEIVRSSEPEFDLQKVGVHFINFSQTVPSSAKVSLNISMNFSVTNYDHVEIKYDESNVTVMYRDVALGCGKLPAFDQPSAPNNTGVEQIIQTVIDVDSVSLMQDDAKNFIRDVTLHDQVDLRVVGNVGARAGPRILWFSPDVKASVNCTMAISPRMKVLISKHCGAWPLPMTRHK